MDTRYQALKKGDIIQPGDQASADGKEWTPFFSSAVGQPVRAPFARRPLSASLLREGIPPLPPGWLFYGKGPLLHEAGDDDELLAIYPENSGWRQVWWSGDSSDASYAIRSGTELARLNGLEPMMPVSSRPEGLPAEMPDPPTPPEGMRWEYRGKGKPEGIISSGSIAAVYIANGKCWNTHNPVIGNYGREPNFHYVEAVPIKPTSQVWTFRSEDPVLPLSSVMAARIAELEACLENTEKWSDIYAKERDGYNARVTELEQQLDRIRDLAIERSR